MPSTTADSTGALVLDSHTSYTHENMDATDGSIFTPASGAMRKLNIGHICKVVREQIVPRPFRRTKGSLSYGSLSGRVSKNGIIRTFGKEEDAVTCPGAVAALIQAQNDGKEGTLHTDGKKNFFFVIGKGGTMLLLKLWWTQGSWSLAAEPVQKKVSLDDHSRFFGPRVAAA